MRSYVLLREGVEVRTVTSTSARDAPRAGGDATPDRLVHYQVVAVDDAGNRSAPAAVEVELPGTERSRVTHLAGVGLLALAGLAGLLYAVRYRRLTRTMRAPREPSGTPRSTRELTAPGRRR